MKEYTKEQLTDPSNLSTLNESISTGGKGFISILGFKPKGSHGEVQDVTYLRGASYENVINKSLEQLQEIESNDDYEVTVKRGIWKDKEGNPSPTNRKSKVYSEFNTVEETYKKGDEDLTLALESIRKTLTTPSSRPVKEYTRIGDSMYSDEGGNVYIRDLIVVDKKIITEGNYPPKASSPKVTIEDKIKRNMPIGKYRQFTLDSEYEAIRIGGKELIQN